MTYKDMKALALYLTSEEDRLHSKYRDLYYDPRKQIFLHRPAIGQTLKYAATMCNGKSRQGWIGKLCIFVGRYDVDVNPSWIVEDMISVQ